MSAREHFCGNCEHWKRVAGHQVARETTARQAPTVIGRCLRFTPQLAPPDGRSLYPTTPVDSWCGEWEVRTWTA